MDDGAPYSGMGLEKFKLMQPRVLPKWNGEFESLPQCIRERPYWQYGPGNHSSFFRKIVGSVVLEVLPDDNNIVQIRHVLIEDSSQWVVGRNATRYYRIMNLNSSTLQVDSRNGKSDCISLVDRDFHFFIPYERSITSASLSSLLASSIFFCATAQLGNEAGKLSWKKKKSIVDKIHNHTCGYSSFSDMRLLLQRNTILGQRC